MKSIEKLREFAETPPYVFREKLIELADEIEAEIERDYMRLPVDADGVPIKHGDTIACAGLSIGPIDVISIGVEGDWLVGHDGNTWELTGDEVHVTPRTLEDVLCDVWKEALDYAKSDMWRNPDEVFAERATEIRELLGSDGEC